MVIWNFECGANRPTRRSCLLIALSLAFLTSEPALNAQTPSHRCPPAAIPSRSRPQIRRLHHLPHRHRQRHHAQHRHRAPGMHRLPRRQSRNPSDRRRAERLRAIRAGNKHEAHPQPTESQTIPAAPPIPTRAYTQWLNGRLELHPLRQSRRPPRRRENLWHQRLSHRRSQKSPNQHDDPRRHAVGRGALQQRRVPAEDPTLRRELRPRRHSAAIAYLPAAHARRNQQERSPAVSRSAAALGNFAARQRACASSNAAAGKSRK